MRTSTVNFPSNGTTSPVPKDLEEARPDRGSEAHGFDSFGSHEASHQGTDRFSLECHRNGHGGFGYQADFGRIRGTEDANFFDPIEGFPFLQLVFFYFCLLSLVHLH